MRAALLGILAFFMSIGTQAQNVTIFKSTHDYETTILRLDSIIKAKNLTYHKMVNYDNQSADVVEGHNRVFIFEDLALTQDVLKCDPLVSLDLPLKILVWDEHGEVYLGYVDPMFMKRRFQLKDCNEKLQQLTSLLVRITNECIKG
ncbi:MAG: DUF302 domain-containing protein [Cyclobacteriaceae bacterium]